MEPAAGHENFSRILGIPFFTGTLRGAVELGLKGGFVVVPAAPALVEMETNPGYREAVQSADFALPDSGFMVLSWKLATGESIRRISGLEYLKSLLDEPDLLLPGAVFWVMPSEPSLEKNLDWLRSRGHSTTREDCYVAPFYSGDAINDPELLKILTARRPRHIVIALGGGVQERLGYYLGTHLQGRPGIHCIGAAIGFLSGDQVRIPMWADRFYAGWLFRCFSAPRRFIPRYWKARRLLPILLKYGRRPPG